MCISDDVALPLNDIHYQWLPIAWLVKSMNNWKYHLCRPSLTTLHIISAVSRWFVLDGIWDIHQMYNLKTASTLASVDMTSIDFSCSLVLSFQLRTLYGSAQQHLPPSSCKCLPARRTLQKLKFGTSKLKHSLTNWQTLTPDVIRSLCHPAGRWVWAQWQHFDRLHYAFVLALHSQVLAMAA